MFALDVLALCVLLVSSLLVVGALWCYLHWQSQREARLECEALETLLNIGDDDDAKIDG